MELHATDIFRIVSAENLQPSPRRYPWQARSEWRVRFAIHTKWLTISLLRRHPYIIPSPKSKIRKTSSWRSQRVQSGLGPGIGQQAR